MNPAMKKFMEEMNKKFGNNALQMASDVSEERAVRIPSPSLSLDIAMGGGVPLGRMIQISGAYSSTKSSLSYGIARNFQMYEKPEFQRELLKKKKQNDSSSRDVWGYKPTGKDVPLSVALIQTEAYAWTVEYGRQLGVDVERLLFNQSAGMEEATELAHQLQLQMMADLLIFDSFEAMTPVKEYDSSMNETVQMGLKQKLFGEYFRKYQATNNLLSREGLTPTTIIGLNQLREKIGAYGDPEYTPGGRAIGFTTSIDIRLRRGDWIVIGTGANKQIIGQEVKFKIHKNKTGTPQRTGSYDFYFDEGGPVPPGHIDNVKELVIEGLAYGVIELSGTWLEYEGLKAQGKDKFIGLLRAQDEDFQSELRESILDVALNTDHDVVDRFGEDDEEEDFDEE